jgi:hypothetical protein
VVAAGNGAIPDPDMIQIKAMPPRLPNIDAGPQEGGITWR